jgi:hypothetical protein
MEPTLNPNGVSLITLTAAIAFCSVITLLGIWFQAKYTSRAITQGPALLTMLGIMGTFFGIGIGLWNFNATTGEDLQSSIPHLIDGMRMSIWASFVGIFFAILLKIRCALFEGTTSEDDDRSEAELIIASLQSLQKAIAGDDEATIISQMKLTRTDVNDRLDALKKSQEESLKRLAEMGSAALVTALKDVIRDFNAKITEQFGDNFKELNSAVKLLVEWQEKYREQMDELIRIERESANSLQTAVQQHKAALESSKGLLDVASSFQNILEAADAYKANLKENTDRLASLIDALRKELPAVKTEISALVKSVSESTIRSEKEVARISAEISERFKTAADAIQNELSTAIATANREVSANVTKLLGSTKEHTEALQSGLEDSLNESLRTLGQQLTSLSSKFVDDYGPITDKLREIVQAGKV